MKKIKQTGLMLLFLTGILFSVSGATHDNDTLKQKKHKYTNRVHTSYYIDIGMNNYLTDNKFPDGGMAWAAKPLGSWYVGTGSNFRIRVVKPLYFNWGFGIDWYNFKFEDPITHITKTDTELIFLSSPIIQDAEPVKSKLSATYLKAHITPQIHIGRSHSSNRWHSRHSGFRLGLGAYTAYRLDSWTKAVVKVNGDKEKEKNHDNYHLNNFRYGVNLEIGFDNIDLFFRYDLNELFTEGKNAPSLNAFTFGFTL